MITKRTALATCLLAATPPVLAQNCADGLLDVQASVVAVTPPETPIARRHGDGARQPLAVDDVLCSGDSLVFLQRRTGAKVRLYLDGAMRDIACCDDFAVPGGALQVGDKLRDYLRHIGDIARSLTTPERRTRPTSARAVGDNPVAFSGLFGSIGAAVGGIKTAQPLEPIQPLRDLPRQSLVAGLPVIVGWHGGRGPYHCAWTDEDTAALATAEVADGAYCELTSPPHAAALRLLDAAEQRRVWRIVNVAWPDVPRPDWVPPGAPPASAAERAAWGVWLWQEGGAAWRLQAIAMLNAERETWVASWLLEGILAEAPPIAAE